MIKIRITEQYLALSFQAIYRQTSNNPKYRYMSLVKDYKMLSNFIKLISTQYQLITLGDDFTNRYIEYQLQYWSALQNVREYSGYFNIAWIFGPKAFQRWLKTGQYKQTLFDTNKIIKFKSVNSESEKLKPPTDYEEVEKNKTENDNRRFDWCYITTSLYHPLSDHCKQCVCSDQCKLALQSEYPDMFKKRVTNV